jgi:ATP-dependent Clp protease ATP-binding subunit ClpA
VTRTHNLAVNVNGTPLQKHLTKQSIELEVTGAAKDLLAKEGYDRVFGARPLRRVITSRIEGQLSEHLLRGKIVRGDTVVVDINPGAASRSTPSRAGKRPPRKIPDPTGRAGVDRP